MMTVYKMNLLARTFGTFAYIMALIWTSGSMPFWMTLLFALLGLVVMEWGYSREDMGLCPDPKTFGACWLGLLWTAIAVIIILGIGVLSKPGFWNDHDFMKRLDKVGIGYIVSAFLQELLLHGYFTNRLGKVFEDRPGLCALLIGVMFGIIHFPNPVLMPATVIFAGGGAYFFLTKSRNLYLLTFAHILLSMAVKNLIATPLIGHGSMRVGPGFWN